MKTLVDLYSKESLRIIGLMSGTSMDGIDICYAEISRNNGQLAFDIIEFGTQPYDPGFHEQIENAMTGNPELLCQFNFDLGRCLGDAVNRFLGKHGVQPGQVDCIGSHGQTIWHIHGKSTLQLGEASMITELTEIPVVSDFRVRDVAAGGSGAPLVPYLDFIMAKDLHGGSLILNVGGMANFTIVPESSSSPDHIHALDTGPGVALIDLLARKISNGSRRFDMDAEYAMQGSIRSDIMEYLMKHPYLRRVPPKSTGREEFGNRFLESLIEHFHLKNSDYPDLIATLTRFTAEAIWYHYNRFFLRNYPVSRIIGSGGGFNNPLIVSHLEALFRDIPVESTSDYGIPPDTKEALLMAVLCAAAIWGIPGNVTNVTGAQHPVVMGKITQ